MRLVVGLVANMVALFATQVVPGITFRGDFVQLAVAGVLLGLFNLIVRPLAMLISLPLLVLTLGLFYFVLNGALLWVAGQFLPGYDVRGLMSGILGALVLGIVNWAVHAVLGTDKDKD
jgi:putative membrane protein